MGKFNCVLELYSEVATRNKGDRLGGQDLGLIFERCSSSVHLCESGVASPWDSWVLPWRFPDEHPIPKIRDAASHGQADARSLKMLQSKPRGSQATPEKSTLPGTPGYPHVGHGAQRTSTLLQAKEGEITAGLVG